MGGVIHVLLVIAVVLILVQFIQGDALIMPAPVFAHWGATQRRPNEQSSIRGRIGDPPLWTPSVFQVRNQSPEETIQPDARAFRL